MPYMHISCIVILVISLLTNQSTALGPTQKTIYFLPQLPQPYSITYSEIHYDGNKLKQLTKSPFLKNNGSNIVSPKYDIQLISDLPEPDYFEMYRKKIFSWIVLTIVLIGMVIVILMRRKLTKNKFMQVQSKDELELSQLQPPTQGSGDQEQPL